MHNPINRRPVYSPFINMVMTRVENGSPDMIPVAFERKFDELKDELPPLSAKKDRV